MIGLTTTTMVRGQYKLDHHQLDVAKYAVLTGKSINCIRRDLLDVYGNPIYDAPQFIPTKHLNRVTLTNIKSSLKSFQRNPHGKSTYQPLPEKWGPLNHYRLRLGCDFETYPPLTTAQYNSQFEPPVEPEVAEDYHIPTEDMVRFSHLPDYNHQPPSVLPVPSLPPINTVTSSELTTADLVHVRTTSEEGLHDACYKLKGPVSFGSITAKWVMELQLKDGICTAFLPGGGGFQVYLGQNVFNVDNLKLAGLTIVSHSMLPVNNAMIYDMPPLVVSHDTVLIPINTGFIPNTLDDLKVVLPQHSSRLGKRLDNTFDVLDAFGTDAVDRGFATEYIALHFKNLPCNLSMDATFQDPELRSIHKQALSAALSSKDYSCSDNLVGNITHRMNGTM